MVVVVDLCGINGFARGGQNVQVARGCWTYFRFTSSNISHFSKVTIFKIAFAIQGLPNSNSSWDLVLIAAPNSKFHEV